MLIAGKAFLLIFLPCALIVYYLLKNPRRKLWSLLLFSYVFYAFAGLKFLPILVLLTALTFYLARRNRFAAGIAVNLLALAVFKYWNFGAENANTVIQWLGMSLQIPLLNFGLPLGISFYVFRHIGYLIDVRAQRYPATDDFLSFAVFSAFFAQISAGPVNSFSSMAGQLKNLPDRLGTSSVYRGLIFISVGLVKKLLIADTIHQILASDMNTAAQIQGAAWAWYMVIAFAMQLYFDFSGYTDIALGIGTLFGLALAPNFESPYLAASPAEFWQRWHISLSSWFRNYLFFPVSRTIITKWKGLNREWGQFMANLGTMTLVGLWHGAGWNFIFWGFYHGLMLGLYAWWTRGSVRQSRTFPVRALFLVSLLIGWALFMSPDASYLSHLFHEMFGLGGLGSLESIGSLAYRPATVATLIALMVAFSGYAETENLLRSPIGARPWFAATVGAMAALSLLFVGEAVQFAYVQF